MTKNPSRKGGRFEREVAKGLSMWVTRGEDDAQLIRSVQSGGWSRRGARQTGDLAANGPHGDRFREAFGIECKNRQDFQWRHLWSSESPALEQWWRKHVGECADADVVPMLVYQRNHHPRLVVHPADLHGLPYATPPTPTIRIEWPDMEPVRVRAWDDMVATDPDEWIAAAHAWLRHRRAA